MQYALGVVPGLTVEMGTVRSRCSSQAPSLTVEMGAVALSVVPGLSVEMGTVCSQCSSRPNGRDGCSTLSM